MLIYYNGLFEVKPFLMLCLIGFSKMVCKAYKISFTKMRSEAFIILKNCQISKFHKCKNVQKMQIECVDITLIIYVVNQTSYETKQLQMELQFYKVRRVFHLRDKIKM